jgi:hypothetical protein
MMTRKQINQQINILRNKLGIDDDVWRNEVLPRFGGKPDDAGRISLNSVNSTNIGSLYRELRQKAGQGAQATHKADQHWPKANQAALVYLRKIWTMWEIMGKQGVVAGNKIALERWCKRLHPDIDRLEWCDAGVFIKIIESLKATAKRSGFTVDSKGFLVWSGDEHHGGDCA